PARYSCFSSETRSASRYSSGVLKYPVCTIVDMRLSILCYSSAAVLIFFPAAARTRLVAADLRHGPARWEIESHFAFTIAIAGDGGHRADRKSTRLNSSHVAISYAVFCL